MNAILQVEDDPNDVALMGHALKAAGIENPVRVAWSGREAIDDLRKSVENSEDHPFPCLILLDLKLPEVMGLDVLRWIRAELPLPVVVLVLSASAIPRDIAEAYSLGANAFITKPTRMETLQMLAGAIKSFWLTYNTFPSARGQTRLSPNLLAPKAA